MAIIFSTSFEDEGMVPAMGADVLLREQQRVSKVVVLLLDLLILATTLPSSSSHLPPLHSATTTGSSSPALAPSPAPAPHHYSSTPKPLLQSASAESNETDALLPVWWSGHLRGGVVHHGGRAKPEAWSLNPATDGGAVAAAASNTSCWALCAEGYPPPFFPDNDSDFNGNPRRAAQRRGSRASFCGEPCITATSHGGTRGAPEADHRHFQGRHPVPAKFIDGNSGGAALISRDGCRSPLVRWGPRFCEMGPSACDVVAAAARWKACECLTGLWAQTTVLWGRMPCAVLGLHVKLLSAAQCYMLPSSRRLAAGQQDARVQRDGGLISGSRDHIFWSWNGCRCSSWPQPWVPLTPIPIRQVLLWCFFDESASTGLLVRASSTSGDVFNKILR